VSVNGIGGPNNTQQPPPPLVGTQSSPTVGTQTGPEDTDEGAPVVNTAEEGAEGGGAIPSPDSDPEGYANQIEATIEEQEDLQALREQLEYLAERGDAKAIELLGKLDAALLNEREWDKLQEEWDEFEVYTSKGDFDGDGLKNKDDLDDDNDTLTDDFEKNVAHSNSFNSDTDGDKIVDWAEVGISNDGRISLKELDGYQNTDINNGDVDGNGVLDGDQLSGSISAKYVGGGTGSGANGTTNGTDGTGGTDGVGSQGQNLLWETPAGDAQAVDGATGGTIDGEGDVVFNASGDLDVSLSEDGNDLIINQGGVITTITGYEGRKIYMNGTSENVTFHDMNAGVLNAQDTNNDGVADSGIKWGENINIASSGTSFDPFNGSVAIDEAASTDEETVYNANGVAGTFQVPDNGCSVWEITFEGNDAIVIGKETTGGDAKVKYRLKDGKAAVENGDITFKGTDADDYFYTEGKITVYGGKGNDFISVGAGSQVYGEDGADYLAAGGTADGTRLDGGAGDDVMEGSDGKDTLVGGAGMDAMYTGTSTGDTLDGGTGDDIGIVHDVSSTADYTIQMGGGIDMSNATNPAAKAGGSVDVEMGTLGGLIDHIKDMQGDAAGALLEELDQAGDLAENAGEMAAETVRNAFLAYLSKKKGQAESAFGSDHSGGYGDDADPVPPPPEEDPGP